MSIYNLELENGIVPLDSELCGGFFNDEEHPIDGITEANVIDLLIESDQVFFANEYYDQGCEHCHRNKAEGSKYFNYSEFHFYLFSKEGSYVMSSLSKDYQGTTLKELLAKGRVDGSYLLSLNVCTHCGDYTIELEYGLF